MDKFKSISVVLAFVLLLFSFTVDALIVLPQAPAVSVDSLSDVNGAVAGNTVYLWWPA